MLNSITRMLKRGPKPEKLEPIPRGEQAMSYAMLYREISVLAGMATATAEAGNPLYEDPFGRLKGFGRHVLSQINPKERQEN